MLPLHRSLQWVRIEWLTWSTETARRSRLDCLDQRRHVDTQSRLVRRCRGLPDRGYQPRSTTVLFLYKPYYTFIHSFISGVHHYDCIAPNVDIKDDSPILLTTAAKCRSMILVTRNIRLRMDIRWGSSGRGRQTTVGLSTTNDIFGYFDDYFFRNFREKASIVCRDKDRHKKTALWHGSAGCRCKIRYISKFTAASHSSPCDSTAFLLLFLRPMPLPWLQVCLRRLQYRRWVTYRWQWLLWWRRRVEH